jgi:hypothetical protein
MPFPSRLDEVSSTVIRVANLTTSLSYRFQTCTANDRVILTAAISVLSQAMTVAESNPAIASKLYSAAMKLSSLTGRVDSRPKPIPTKGKK